MKMLCYHLYVIVNKTNGKRMLTIFIFIILAEIRKPSIHNSKWTYSVKELVESNPTICIIYV